jgi:phosphonate degradation associated HDIG domain protein
MKGGESPSGDGLDETARDVLRLFAERGDSGYGGEAVTQREHALQTALLAEESGADSALVAAALLHDIGHLLHRLPNDAPEQGKDDRHETLAARWLEKRFPPAVTEPVRLHVAAKRYLCAVDPEYRARLSAPSESSLKLQGGPMTADEAAAFAAGPYAAASTMLRRWDDEAKDPEKSAPPVDHFIRRLAEARSPSNYGEATRSPSDSVAK